MTRTATVYGPGGFDPSKPDNNVVETYEVEGEQRPDVNGVLDTLGNDLPRSVARKVLDGYVVSALQRGRWQRAWDALADSHADGDLTDGQWDAIQQVAADHNLPAPESA